MTKCFHNLILCMTGVSSWFLWRSAYLTKLGSWRLRMQVPIDWTKTILFGRDISRFDWMTDVWPTSRESWNCTWMKSMNILITCVWYDSCQTLRNTVLLIHVKLLLNHAMCVVVNMLIHVHCVGTGTLH